MSKYWLATTVTVVILLATLGEPVPASGKNEYKKQKLTIIGTVIAYERTPLQVIDLSFVPNIEVMYVRIERRLNGQEPSPYIRVVYEHGKDEPSLLKEVSNSKVQWRFTLKRDGRCDSSLGEIKAAKPQAKEGEELTLPRLKFTSETKGLTDDTKLPCYALKPGNYRAKK